MARKHGTFSILQGTITREYERKGYSPRTARDIARRTAAKISRLKKRKKR